jgi:hypothetical protein
VGASGWVADWVGAGWLGGPARMACCADGLLLLAGRCPSLCALRHHSNTLSLLPSPRILATYWCRATRVRVWARPRPRPTTCEDLA